MEIFELYVETHFCAAHALKGYLGDCARLHGHTWGVKVFLRCSGLDEVGFAIDFRDVRAAVQAAVAGLDHQNLSELPAFQTRNPTCENVARFLFQELSRALNSPKVTVHKVSVSESPSVGVTYWGS